MKSSAFQAAVLGASPTSTTRTANMSGASERFNIKPQDCATMGGRNRESLFEPDFNFEPRHGTDLGHYLSIFVAYRDG